MLRNSVMPASIVVNEWSKQRSAGKNGRLLSGESAPPGGVSDLTLSSGILRGHGADPGPGQGLALGLAGTDRGLALMDVRHAGRVASRARQTCGGQSVG